MPYVKHSVVKAKANCGYPCLVLSNKAIQKTIQEGKKFCECGCGWARPAVDKRGRPRRFIKGHDNKFKTGSENLRWKGGRHNDSKGYAMVQCVGHPKANAHGYVYEHILVMERYFARYLDPDVEVVHHIDRNKQNNDIINLQIMTRAEHASYHAKLRKQNKFGLLMKRLEHIL